MIPRFDFDEDVAIEAILYICARVNSPTFHKISKMMYFADKLHLERYGRFICGDSYVAMPNGPVPSATYTIMKAPKERSPIYNKVKDAFNVQGYTVIPLREADEDSLSESDIECLDSVIARHGHKSFTELTDLSHDAAWYAAWGSGPRGNEPITIEHIASMFEDGDDLLEHLANPHE